MNRMSPALWECSRHQTRWQSRARAAASLAAPRVPVWRQCSGSFELSKSSSKGRTMVFRLPSATSSSSKTGSDTTYFSLAQLPRSRSRQRSLQKGKSAWTAESVSALQMGHLCFMVFFLANSVFSALKKSYAHVTEIADVQKAFASRKEYSSGEYAEGCPSRDAMKFFGGRNGRHGHGVEAGPCGGLWQNFHDTANQVVSICLGNFHASNVAGFRDFSARQFNVRDVQLPIDLRSHAFEPSFPHERIIFRRAFDQRCETVFFGYARLCPQILGAQILSRNFLLNGHQAIAAIADRLRIHFIVQGVASRIVHVGVLKHAHPVELRGLHEIAQLPEIAFRLARKSHDERSAQRDAGNGR